LENEVLIGILLVVIGIVAFVNQGITCKTRERGIALPVMGSKKG